MAKSGFIFEIKEKQNLNNASAEEKQEIAQVVRQKVQNTAPEQKKQIIEDVFGKEMGKDIIEQNLGVEDLSLRLANAMVERSKMNSEAIYSGLILETKNIVKNMNDGFISDADLDRQEKVLSVLHRREHKLRTCMQLCSGSSSPKAKLLFDKLAERYNKFSELQAIIRMSTKTRAEVMRNRKVKKEEYFKAKVYLKVLDLWSENKDISPSMKDKLGIMPKKMYGWSRVSNLIDKRREKEKDKSRQEILDDLARYELEKKRITALRGIKVLQDEEEIKKQKTSQEQSVNENMQSQSSTNVFDDVNLRLQDLKFDVNRYLKLQQNIKS